LGINQAKRTKQRKEREENSELKKKENKENRRLLIHPLGAKTIYTSGGCFQCKQQHLTNLSTK
jgi:hypothetical protein